MDAILDDIRRQVPRIKGAQVEFIDMGQMFLGATAENSPIMVKVFGKDLEKLKGATDRMLERSRSVEGLRDVDTTLRSASRRFRSLSTGKRHPIWVDGQPGSGDRQSCYARGCATKYRIEGDEFDIRVRFRDFDRSSLDDVRNIQVALPAGGLVPLYQVADIVQKMGPVKITRESQERKVTLRAKHGGAATWAASWPI